MKYSKKWLQEYIKESLPNDEEIIQNLNAKAFEVEGVEKATQSVDGKEFQDCILDIKVLPNRAHDALSHKYMAYELCSILNLTRNEDKTTIKNTSNSDSNVEQVKVEIEDIKACSRFSAVRIDGIKVINSNENFKNKLNAIGQKSINNIVDATNIVQFSLNKPMHAYDSRSIKGKLIARFAKEGEILVTLDDRELKLDNSTLVIADEEKVLGLAGIKGGKYSGVKDDTTSIVLESANFDPILIRKTAERYGIRTDASKRFENGISDQLVEDGINATVNLLSQEFPNLKVGATTDIGNQNNINYTIGVTLNEVNKTLGSGINDTELQNLFKTLDLKFEIINLKKYIVETYPKLIGAKYKNPASQRLDAPSAFSCSSLISYLYKGVWMPSLSIDKYVFTQRIQKEDLKFGDLIFSNTGEGMIRTQSVEFLRGTEVQDGVDHVAMYLGEGKVLHATKVTGEVCVQDFSEYEKSRKEVGYGRVVNDLDLDIYVASVPEVRLDLRIKEDLIEEIGRVYGFEKLKISLPQINNRNKNFLNSKLSLKNEIRNILVSSGFSEVYNYSLSKDGEVELVKSASNKTKLRTNLSDGMLECWNKNIGNSTLLEIDVVKIFEIGNIFKNGNECTSLCICMDDGKKKTNYSESVDMLLSEIKSKLNLNKIEIKKTSQKPYTIELILDDLETNEVAKEKKDVYIDSNLIQDDIKFKSYSIMPYIVRDVAFWVNEVEVNKDEIKNLIKENAGLLCIKVVKFDEFQKEGKLSLGYRLIYQSEDRTLTDEEVNKDSDNVYEVLKAKGFEIR